MQLVNAVVFCMGFSTIHTNTTKKAIKNCRKIANGKKNE